MSKSGVVSRIRFLWPHVWRPGLFVLALLAGLAIYWSVLYGNYAQMREQVRADTQQMAGQTAQALALQVHTMVRKLDYFSQQLGWLWLQGDEETFDSSAQVAIRTLPPGALIQVAVADAKGNVVYSSLRQGGQAVHLATPVSVFDRPHFRVHLSKAESVLDISDPIKGRLSGQWSIQFSRGLWREGEFQGVVVLSVSAEHLAHSLKVIFPDQEDVASLVTSQGVYLARSFHLAEVLGKRLPPTRPFITHPNENHGTYEVTADVDRISRLYSWQRVEDYPLVVLVGLATSQALGLTEASINDSRWQSTLGSILLLLTGIAVAWLWTQRSVRATELQTVAEALRAREAQLRMTLDAVRDGLWTVDHLNRMVYMDDRIREILDLEGTTGALELDRVMALVHPLDLARLQREGESQILYGGSPSDIPVFNHEVRIRRSDGRWRWILVRGGVVERDAEGKPMRSIGTLSDISERVADANLRHALLDRSSAAILLVNSERRIVQANAQFQSIFLKQGQSLKDLDLRDIHVDDEHWQKMGLMYSAVRAQGQLRMEYPFRDASGDLRWFDTHAILQDPDDSESNVIWTWVDITSRHEADAALAVETLRLNTLLECFPGGVLIEDSRDVVVFVNALWSRLLGLELVASNLRGMHDMELRERLGPQVSSWLRSPHPGRSIESRRSHEVISTDGRHLEIDHVEIRQGNEYLGSVWLVRDITQRKVHELELAQLASTDTLTQLPNRRTFLARLQALQAEAQVRGCASGLVCMLDIDHFKRVNDTYGHAAGDMVLQRVAEVLRTNLRGSDMAGRLGGEEFAALMPGTSVAEGVHIAERMRQTLESLEIEVDGQLIRITISIGIAEVQAEGSPDQALRHADEALYRAKNTGRNRVCVWSEEAGGVTE